MKRRFCFLLILLSADGCGIQPLGEPRSCADGRGCPAGDVAEVTSGVSSAAAPGGSTSQPPPGVPVDDVAELDGFPEESPLLLPATFPALDPFALSIFTLTDAPALLSGLLDGLVLDVINTAPRSGTFTFLELLCINQGDPEFLCRQRFGR